MVKFQEVAKYGRASGVEFGPVDVVRFAEAFGARGFMIRSPDEVEPTLTKALEMPGPVLIGVPVDYQDNVKLMDVVYHGAFDCARRQRILGPDRSAMIATRRSCSAFSSAR